MLRRLNRYGVLVRALQRDERGVTAVEFALVLPFLILLFVGLVEFSQAFTVTRKLSNTVSTIADLVSQEPMVSTADLIDVERVAEEIMKPYSDTDLDLTIVSVVEQDGTASVAWSHPASAYPAGTTYDNLPPEAILGTGESLIIAEGTYNFTPTVTRFLGTFDITQRAFFRPRIGGSVDKSG